MWQCFSEAELEFFLNNTFGKEKCRYIPGSKLLFTVLTCGESDLWAQASLCLHFCTHVHVFKRERI